MNNNQNTAGSGGVGFLGLLTLLLIGLKLTNNVDFSWWWVLAPIWIPTLIGVVIVGLFLIVVAIFGRD